MGRKKRIMCGCLPAATGTGTGTFPDKRLKTGRGPINFDTSTCVKLLLINNIREKRGCQFVKSVVVS